MPMEKLCFLSLAVLLWGCSTFEEEVLPDQADSPRQLSVSAVEEPGPDPGSLEIMQRAVDSVAAHSGQRSRSASVSGAQIEPTHRYVRFSPATKAQFDALFDQDEFTCYNFPLDEVSPVSADEGFRMSGPSDTPEQLYAVLRTTVVLPDTIASEVLKELYDPSVTERGVADPAWADRVWAEARALIDDERHPGELFWTPSGEVKAWDDVAEGYIPIQGVTISIINPSDILGVVRVKTGADGKFVSTKTLHRNVAVKYSLSWDDDEWMVKDTRTSSAGIVQSNVSGEWKLRISTHPSLAHATIFRAAYRYWYKMSAYGLTPPHFGRKVRIVNYDAPPPEDKAGVFHSAPDFSANEPDIEICGRMATTCQIFAVASHELGHAAHFSYNEPYYHKVNKLIKESWGRFTEYLLTNQEYKDLESLNKLHSYLVIGGVTYQRPSYYNQQNWYLDNGDVEHRIYSPMFIDLYDNFNQYEWYSTLRPEASMNGLLHVIPDDDICIPSAREIQEIAFGSKNSREAGGWIIQYAGRYGYNAETIDRFWRVYSMINNEDSY